MLSKDKTGTRIMAALNVSPESFYGGSIARGEATLQAAVRRAEAEGASLIDIGAMSTAPYKAAYIGEAEELARMHTAVAAARGATGLPISADTQRAAVAEAALAAGATHINDVSGLRDDARMGEVCARAGAGVVLMANDNPDLDEAGELPVQVTVRLLTAALNRAAAAGIPRTRIILDPGIGFFRHRSVPWHEWDMEVLRHLGELRSLGCPLLVGVSRKSMFKKLLGREDPADRLAGSLAVAFYCAQLGVEWLRVHDVAETRDVLLMSELLRK